MGDDLLIDCENKLLFRQKKTIESVIENLINTLKNFVAVGLIKYLIFGLFLAVGLQYFLALIRLLTSTPLNNPISRLIIVASHMI